VGQAFPGGICDEDCSVAYLRPATGELLAIDLADGRIRWRQAEAGKPIAASIAHVLTLREEESALDLLNAVSGRLVARLRAAELPGFDRVAAGDALDADVVETPEGPRISWRSERRYWGGASPPAHLARTTPSAGSVLFDPATGQVRPVPLENGRPVAAPLEPLTDGADMLASAGRGDAAFSLRQEDGELMLEARDHGGDLRWAASLGAAGSRRPKPLRA
jgi:hypothetical protein